MICGRRFQEFVRILNEKMTRKPFEIDAGGVMGDARIAA